VLVIGLVLLLLVLATLIHARHAARSAERGLAEARLLVERLGLTDLALFTEARYTRHPTQADLPSPFQDHPGALEHFPSGSFLGPPSQLRDAHGYLDRAAEIPR
jgi:hypothetical protein